MKSHSFKTTPKKVGVVGSGSGKGNTLVASLDQAVNQRDSRTENNAVTHSTTLKACVDLFFVINASRKWSKAQKIEAFMKAFTEDALTALRILFWSRDIRGGAGERQFFRDIMEYAFDPKSSSRLRFSLLKNLALVPEFGRWDDLWVSLGTIRDEDAAQIMALIKKGLMVDNNGLLAKWMPRRGEQAAYFRKMLGLDPRGYRKLIVGLSKTVEQDMSAGLWEKINYEHVPSVAMNKYRKAYYKHDESRFQMFIDSVTKGEAKINASAIFPHDLYRALVNRGESESAVEAQWMNLPNLLEEGESIIPVVDVSGSMTWHPIDKTGLRCLDVAVALGVYLSERLSGPFKDRTITFSDNARFIKLAGSLRHKFSAVANADWAGSTNLQSVFDLILKTAVANKVPQSDMPTKVVIFSDMEFNAAVRMNGSPATNLDVIREKYKASGYKMPKVVFWNIDSRSNSNFPASHSDPDVALIGGYSAQLFKAILGGDDFTPYGVMMKTLTSDRYANIQV